MQTETDPKARRAVIVVSSHVVRGTVGNRAAVFALETLGHPVWAVPTVILPWHPGHGRATRIVPQDFAALMNDLAGAPWLGEVGAVLSGYLGEAAQAAGVASLVAAVRARSPGALYVCDPVIGDAGGLYVPEATAAAIRDTLIPLADVATPNRFELEWLSGRKADDLAAHHIDVGAQLLRRRVVPVLGAAFERGAHRSDRRAQLVRDVGDEDAARFEQGGNAIALGLKVSHRPLERAGHRVEIALKLRDFVLALHRGARGVVAAAERGRSPRQGFQTARRAARNEIRQERGGR